MRCVMSKGKQWANSSKGNNNSQWRQRYVEWTWNEKIRYVWMHKNAWMKGRITREFWRNVVWNKIKRG
jgi:hypothetical protein